MNRLFHVRETLPENILLNIEYENLEFILLDYNSTDGLENWVKAKMLKYLESGKLKYFRTNDPKYFSLCHSKNVASVLSTGEIIGIVDADNYTGQGYAQWINNVFEKEGDQAVTTTIHKTFIPYRDTGGKVAYHRDLFYKTRGFDESFVGYGFDDVDFINRLELNGGKRIYIDSSDYLRCLNHSNIERLSKNFIMSNIEEIYKLDNLRYNGEMVLIYLCGDYNFIKASYTYNEDDKYNQFISYEGWKLNNTDWYEGKYSIEFDNFQLFMNDSKEIYQMSEKSAFYCNNDVKQTWEIVPLERYIEYILLYTECRNRIKFNSNSLNTHSINQNGFGQGTFFRNFQELPIHIINDGEISF